MFQRLLFSQVFLCLILMSYCATNRFDCYKKEKHLTLLDTISDSITKAKIFSPNCTDGNSSSKESDCSEKDKSSAYLHIATVLISDARKLVPTCPEIEPQIRHEKPMDCFEVLQNGNNASGVYTIWPRNRIHTNRSLDVFCDMDTDGNGWTVLQRRGDFSPKVDFYKDWKSYKSGFGDISRDFWIGNDNIFVLSNQEAYKIRFDLRDTKGAKSFAEYKNFWVEDEKTNYTLHIDDYSGDAGDSMEYSNGMMFSTKDRNNDQNKGKESCSSSKRCGWWFKGCTTANPNGLYQPGKMGDPKSMYWRTWKGYEGLAFIEIKLARL